MKEKIEKEIFKKMKYKNFGESMSDDTKIKVLKWTINQIFKQLNINNKLIEINNLKNEYKNHNNFKKELINDDYVLWLENNLIKIKKIIENQKNSPSEFSNVVNDNFWKLI